VVFAGSSPSFLGHRRWGFACGIQGCILVSHPNALNHRLQGYLEAGLQWRQKEMIHPWHAGAAHRKAGSIYTLLIVPG